MPKSSKNNSKLSYNEAVDMLMDRFKGMSFGQLSEFCRENPEIPYPTLNAFINGTLKNYKPQKLIKDCLKAFGYGDYRVEKEIIFIKE